MTYLEVEGDVFNVASGIPVSIREMVEKVRNITGSGKPVYGKVPYRSGENMELFASISKAKNILQWEPEVSLKDGLTKTINYFAINHAICKWLEIV